MRISFFTVYGSMPGSVAFESQGIDMKFDFSEEEAAQLRAAVERIIEARQPALVRAASQPFAALADFSEVPDDMPF